MKRIIRNILLCAFATFGLQAASHAQSLKTNIPMWLTGSPNIGFEMSVSSKFSVNADLGWMPYMFKKHEEVFRILIGSIDLRYYPNPTYYYTNDCWNGFYLGPYAEYARFNIGFYKSGDQQSYRRKGWGVSGGVSTGYKFYLSPRLSLDLNIGLGFAHLQYDKHFLGGEYADTPVVGGRKITRAWWGPTKFGVHLTYNIFR